MRVVIPSVHYADFLAVTLPAWRAWLNTVPAQIVVATRPDCRTDIALARDHGVTVVTEGWGTPGVRLDKASALDAGFRGVVPGEICLAVDADVVPFGRIPLEIDAGTLYSCPRYACSSPAALEAHQRGDTRREDLRLIPPRRQGDPSGARPMTPVQAARFCLGYFLLFRYGPGLSFGSFPTAGGYDTYFRKRFLSHVGLTDCYVLHLGDRDRANWRGRILPVWGAA